MAYYRWPWPDPVISYVAGMLAGRGYALVSLAYTPVGSLLHSMTVEIEYRDLPGDVTGRLEVGIAHQAAADVLDRMLRPVARAILALPDKTPTTEEG